ncbi:hypothetical protein Tco_1221561 [Tanacetum coccineum]
MNQPRDTTVPILLNKIEECLYTTVPVPDSPVNAAGTKLQLLKVITGERLELLKDKDCLKIKITYETRIVIYSGLAGERSSAI